MLRTGKMYRDALSAHPRSVWVGGAGVQDVSSDVRFSKAIRVISDIYEIHRRGGDSSVLSFRNDLGAECPTSLLQPKSISDLERRRAASQELARMTGGLVGRSQEFMNTAIAAFGASSDWFDAHDHEHRSNAARLYERVSLEQPFVIHGAIDPQPGKHRGPEDVGALRISERTRKGIVVRGTKLIATGAAIADEVAVFPLPGLSSGDEARTIAFVAPIDSKGIHILMRDPMEQDSKLRKSEWMVSPRRFQELDCFCIFQDVFVPHEQILFSGSVSDANEMYDATGARALTAHRDLLRACEKLGVLIGVAALVAQSSGIDGHLHVEARLGESVGMHQMVAAAICGSELAGAPLDSGLVVPDRKILLSMRCHLPRMFAFVVDLLQELAGASVFVIPSEKTGVSSIDSAVATAFRTVGNGTIDRGLLLRIARELTSEEFGQRQLMFERNHAGDPMRLAAGLYRSEVGEYVSRGSEFLDCLDEPNLGEFENE